MELDLGGFPALIFSGIRITNLNMAIFMATMNLQIFVKCFFFSKICFGYLLCASVVSHYIVSNSCGPVECSPPVPSVHGLFQAGILELAAIFSSRGSP